MSSLLNKLTGHHSNDTTKTHDNHNNHTTTSTTGHTTHNPLNTSTTTTQTTQQTTTTGSNPYGATGTMNTGAAYTGANTSNMSNMSNTTHSTTGSMANTGYSHQGTAVRDDAITRSEEQLHVNKQRVETGKAELNKYVTTEHVEQAVPVTKEKVVIEREPITDANRGQAMSGPAISEAHYETTLKEDRISATKETVPIERIRLAKQTETTVENVGADLRKEHVDFTHSKLANDNMNNMNHSTTGNMTTNAGVPHTKLNNNY